MFEIIIQTALARIAKRRLIKMRPMAMLARIAGMSFGLRSTRIRIGQW
jgi:hypothetical protein